MVIGTMVPYHGTMVPWHHGTGGGAVSWPKSTGPQAALRIYGPGPRAVVLMPSHSFRGPIYVPISLKLFQNSSNIENFPSTATVRRLSYYQGDGTLVTNGESGYGFGYEFGNATVDDIVRPSATPAVFELRNAAKEIYGRVV